MAAAAVSLARGAWGGRQAWATLRQRRTGARPPALYACLCCACRCCACLCVRPRSSMPLRQPLARAGVFPPPAPRGQGPRGGERGGGGGGLGGFGGGGGGSGVDSLGCRLP